MHPRQDGTVSGAPDTVLPASYPESVLLSYRGFRYKSPICISKIAANIFILLISAKYLINYFLIYAIKYKNMHY